jgi:hypothetical protein
MILNFLDISGYKKRYNKFVHPSLLLLFLDPGSELRDPGWTKIRIRDKHPGSAILHLTQTPERL